jgi:subtilisin-like proprotein convertase family protein
VKKLFTIILFASTCILKAQTYTWTGITYIMDNTADTVPIAVSGLPNVIDNSFGLAHVCFDITHTYKNDLLIKIMSPDGHVDTLIDNTGGSADNFLGTCVGMDGTALSNGTAPFGGLFIPISNISLLNNGQNPNGIWKLIVIDQANADTGSVHRASLEFTNNPPVGSQGGGGGGPTGTYNCATCTCPDGSNACDLLPDMTSSYKEILNNHTEMPGYLYISNATPNIGAGPIDIYGIDSCFCGTIHVPCGTTCADGSQIKQIVKQRIYQKLPGVDSLGYYDRIAGTMTYHATHGHLHVDGWANYTLRTPTSNPDATTWPIIGTGIKQSFCLVNLGTCAGNVGECLDNNGNPVTTVPNQGLGFHTGCTLTQGIYPGSYDVYSISLNDPIPLNNVCNGQYYIVSITDPNNNFLESDETNNWVAVPITLTQQNATPSISAQGPTKICPGDNVTLSASTASNYLWSTGETTQAIVVSTPGDYTVSTNCGSSVSTSSPVSITLAQIDAISGAVPSAVSCGGDAVQLSSSVNSNGTQLQPLSFTSNQVIPIPDNISTGVTSSIVVNGINGITLNANSIVSVQINITHTYDGDLAVSLISPSGNSILLSNRRGAGGDNFTNTVFSMSASTLISAGAAPFTGTFKPDGNFSTLSGNANGTWMLMVQDLAAVDIGNILSWTITINNDVPETFNYAWTSTPPGFTSSIQNPIVHPLTSTSYNVFITSNATGCSSTQTVNVTVPPMNTYYADNDGDGYGQSGNSLQACAPAGIFTAVNGGDCLDNNPDAHPGATEICGNLIDDNCDGNIDEGCTVSLNIKMFIEAFYIGAGKMVPVLHNSNLTNDLTICDTITIDLYNSFYPFTKVTSVKTILYTNGTASAFFQPAILNSSYYIAIRHRNIIETWSKFPLMFDSSAKSFDFTVF